MSVDLFPSDRLNALRRLEEFAAAGVSAYARTRNFVQRGHGNVSRLSAAVRHRLITEEEVIAAVLSAHRFAEAEKFVQEVLWRTYWKGWLEQRPGVWEDYVRISAMPRPAAGAALLDSPDLSGAMGRFTAELRETGYLHNHARMWWAAWWCHQHGLPWAAGARFFHDHLLDADAASNTLGWRWVAGLQTPGKTYLARRDNVAKYCPDHGSLGEIDDHVVPRIPPESADLARMPLAEYPESPPTEGRIALLGHPDDLSIETSPLGRLRPAVAALVDQPGANDGAAKKAWRARAVEDAARRWSNHYGVCVERLSGWEEVAAWCTRHGCETLVLMAPFIGPDNDGWQPVRRTLSGCGVEVVACRRAWDRQLFPAARAGFFPFWHKTRSWLGRCF